MAGAAILGAGVALGVAGPIAGITVVGLIAGFVLVSLVPVRFIVDRPGALPAIGGPRAEPRARWCCDRPSICARDALLGGICDPRSARVRRCRQRMKAVIVAVALVGLLDVCSTIANGTAPSSLVIGVRAELRYVILAVIVAACLKLNDATLLARTDHLGRFDRGCHRRSRVRRRRVCPLLLLQQLRHLDRRNDTVDFGACSPQYDQWHLHKLQRARDRLDRRLDRPHLLPAAKPASPTISTGSCGRCFPAL